MIALLKLLLTVFALEALCMLIGFGLYVGFLLGSKCYPLALQLVPPPQEEIPATWKGGTMPCQAAKPSEE